MPSFEEGVRLLRELFSHNGRPRPLSQGEVMDLAVVFLQRVRAAPTDPAQEGEIMQMISAVANKTNDGKRVAFAVDQMMAGEMCRAVRGVWNSTRAMLTS